jgi:hypothetical protein
MFFGFDPSIMVTPSFSISTGSWLIPQGFLSLAYSTWYSNAFFGSFFGFGLFVDLS